MSQLLGRRKRLVRHESTQPGYYPSLVQEFPPLALPLPTAPSLFLKPRAYPQKKVDTPLLHEVVKSIYSIYNHILRINSVFSFLTKPIPLTCLVSADCGGPDKIHVSCFTSDQVGPTHLGVPRKFRRLPCLVLPSGHPRVLLSPSPRPRLFGFTSPKMPQSNSGWGALACRYATH